MSSGLGIPKVGQLALRRRRPAAVPDSAPGAPCAGMPQAPVLPARARNGTLRLELTD